VPRRSAEDALRLVPGVTLVQHGSEGKGYQFLVRGFDAAHGADFEIDVDGLPVNEWSNVHAQGYLDLGFVIPELVTSVRVTKGPFTLEQGAFAMAGSASYHLGVADEDRGLTASYTLGSSNRHRGLLTYSPHSGEGHDFIASETLHDEGFGSRRQVSKGTIMARTELADSERTGTWSLLSGAYLARFQLPGALRAEDAGAGRVAHDGSYADTFRGASMRAFSALSYERSTATQQSRGIVYAGLRRLEVVESFTGYLLYPTSGDLRSQRQDSLNVGTQLSHSLGVLPAVTAHARLGVMADVMKQRQAHVDGAEQLLHPERELNGLQALAHGGVGVTWQAAPELRLDLGARLDVAHVRVSDELAAGERATGTLAAASPRAVAEWRALVSTRFFAAYGRGFRPPEARAFSRFEPSVLGLTEERFEGGAAQMTTSDSFELGVRYRASQLFTAQLSTFATLIARESVYDHVSGVNVELNGTRRLGAELSLRSAVTSYLSLSADATAVDARFAESGRVVPMAPTLFGGARLVAGKNQGARGGLRLLAIAPRSLPHGAMSSTQTQLDLTAGYHWQTWRLDLEVENLLNQRRRDGEYHFASHWQRSSPVSNLPTLHYTAGSPIDARLTLSAVF
jgi:iron complex outermembrane receptor protein